MKRPRHLDPPADPGKPPPAPEPHLAEGPAASDAPPDGEEQRLDPTRYGDWEKNGIAVDF